jgi:aminoglycoside 3-N-acetyltransferase I
MDFTVRRLRAGDEEPVREVAQWLKGADIPSDRAAAFLANDANYLIVAEVSGKIIGVVLAYRLERIDHPSGQLFVYDVEVAESHRRRSVGRALMGHVRDIVEREQLKEAFVLTTRDNAAAIALYSSTGAIADDEEGVVFVYPGSS